MEKNTAVTVQERYTPSSGPTSPTQQQGLPASESFFSWIQDPESKEKSIKQARAVPWVGIIALALSAVTSILSFVLLKCVNGRTTWSTDGIGKLTQPASWLSALISANSIFLHIALTEGVTVAWWFRATRPSATIRDLHKVWATGTSAKSAATDWKGFNYVSLATLFVAIIPLNGFLLQGALFTTIQPHYKDVEIYVPMIQQQPLGYSATENQNGEFTSTVGTRWPIVFQQATNIVGSLYSTYAYWGNWNYWYPDERINSELYENDTMAIWNTKIPGAGFNMSCVASTIPYNLSIDNGNFSRLIYNSSFTWEPSAPNTINFDIMWKPDYNCTGDYQVRNCTLQAAVVEYPLQLELNVSKAVPGPYYSLTPATTWHDDKVIREHEVYPEENLYNSTYFGMFNSFRKWYGGNITLDNYYRNSTKIRINQSPGGFLQGLLVDYGLAEVDGDVDETCQLGLSYGLENMRYFESFNSETIEPDAEGGWAYGSTNDADLSEVILEQIRQASFLAAVYSGSMVYTDNYVPSTWFYTDVNGSTDWYLPNWDREEIGDTFYLQYVNATRTKIQATYGVRYYLWGASVGLTYAIILVVLPTFWGFWVLVRKPTMSPVDMARAFNAPVVTADGEHRQLQVKELLKEVGTVPIHGAAVVGSQGGAAGGGGGGYFVGRASHGDEGGAAPAPFVSMR